MREVNLTQSQTLVGAIILFLVSFMGIFGKLLGGIGVAIDSWIGITGFVFLVFWLKGFRK